MCPLPPGDGLLGTSMYSIVSIKYFLLRDDSCIGFFEDTPERLSFARPKRVPAVVKTTTSATFYTQSNINSLQHILNIIQIPVANFPASRLVHGAIPHHLRQSLHQSVNVFLFALRARQGKLLDSVNINAIFFTQLLKKVGFRHPSGFGAPFKHLAGSVSFGPGKSRLKSLSLHAPDRFGISALKGTVPVDFEVEPVYGVSELDILPWLCGTCIRWYQRVFHVGVFAEFPHLTE